MHYGTPLWLRGSFLDPDYPARVAEYAVAMVERYGGIAGGWTPLNEPVVSADFSGRRGVWPPHLRGQSGHDLVLITLAEGIARTIAAIRSVRADVTIVAAEPCDVAITDEPSLEMLVAETWQHHFLPLGLVRGRVDGAHPLYGRLVGSGVSAERLERLRTDPQTVDVVGVNFYPSMSCRRLVTIGRRLVRQNRRGGAKDLADALVRFHRHTGLPIMVTETSDVGRVEDRARWMDASVMAVARLRSAGVPVIGYTWFPVFSHGDWRWRRGPHSRDAYWCHMGLWDIDERLRRVRTPLADRFATLAAGGPPRWEAAA